MRTCLCSSAHVRTLTSLVDRSLPSSSTYSILTFGRYSLFSGKADSRSYRESSLQDISRYSCKVRAVEWHTSWPADPGDNTGNSEGRSFQTKCSTYILIPALSDSIRLHAAAVSTPSLPKYWQVVVPYESVHCTSLSPFPSAVHTPYGERNKPSMSMRSDTCNHDNISSVFTVTMTTWAVCSLLPWQHEHNTITSNLLV